MDVDYLLDERLRETYAEVDRRASLNRLGKLVERVQLHNPKSADLIQPHNVLFPIPTNAINSNTGAVLEQNPGYN